MKIFILTILTLLTAVMYPEVFKFKYSQGQKQRVECTVHGKNYINGVFNSEFTLRYKTIATVSKIENNAALINEINYYYESSSSTQYKEISKTVNNAYLKDQRGMMSINDSELFPTFRNMPLFPEQDIKEGYKWNDTGFEVQDFFRDDYITSYPIDAHYEFVGYVFIDNKKCALINIEFNADIINDGKKSIDPRIDRISHNGRTELYFDNPTGNKIKEDYINRYYITINNYEIRIDNEGTRIWYPIELMQKDKILDDLNKDIKDRKLIDSTIANDVNGIKISLENIRFQPESSILLESEKSRLDKIAEILKKYKGKGLMITGHTTDKGTEKNRQRLSVDRAKVVTEYLLKKDAIDPSKTSYIGKGGTEPVADNNTEEGMNRNRRVEISILEE